METLSQIVRQFLNLAIEIAPYFLVGTLAGAFLKSWLPFSVVERYLKPGIRSTMAVSIFGGLVPVCSCSMVPVARAMKDRGAALGAVVAFLIVAPVLSPITIFLTWGWLGPRFTVARIVAAFTGALLAGAFVERFGAYPSRAGVEPDVSGANGVHPGGAGQTGDLVVTCASDASAAGGECGSEKPCAAPKSGLALLWFNFVMILKDLWLYLVIGVGAASVVSVAVPKDFIPSLIGTGPLAHLLAAAIGVPIYVCSGEEIPIAKALLDIHLTPGATFTFLLSSTGICLPTILMASRFLGKRNAALYASFWLVFAVCAGFVFSLAGRS